MYCTLASNFELITYQKAYSLESRATLLFHDECMHSLNKYCKFITMKHVTGSVNGYPLFVCMWILTRFLEIYIY